MPGTPVTSFAELRKDASNNLGVAVQTNGGTPTPVTSFAELRKDASGNLNISIASGGSALADDQTLAAPAATIVVPIPTGGKAIRMYINGRCTAAGVIAAAVALQFNADASAIYDLERTTGVAATVAASESLAQTSGQIGQIPGANGTRAAASGSLVVFVPNYAGTTFEKTWVSTGGFADSTTGQNGQRNIVGAWESAVAITSVTILTTNGTTFATGTRVTTYIDN